MSHFHTIRGYDIVLVPIKDSEIVFIQSYILSGRMNEGKKDSGISHLLEHVLTEGWKKCKDDCAKYWGKKGIITNASTGDSTINYYVETLQKNCPEVLEYIIKITTNPQIKESRVKDEKKAVKEEMSRDMNDPTWEIINKLSQVLYKHSGLQNGANAPLQIKNLKHISKTDVTKYCKKIYTPQNTLFVVSGNFKPSLVLSFFRKFLPKGRKLGKRNLKTNIINKITQPTFHHIFNKYGERNATITISFYSPIRPFSRETMAFNIIVDLLSGGMQGLLMRRLRTELKLIYNIYVYLEPDITGTIATIETTGKEEKTLQIITEINNVLNKVCVGDFPDSQLLRIKDRFLIKEDKKCKNLIFFGNFYGEQYINQLYEEKPNIISYKERVRIIKSIKKREIMAVCKKIFPLNKQIVIYQSKNKQHD